MGWLICLLVPCGLCPFLISDPGQNTCLFSLGSEDICRTCLISTGMKGKDTKALGLQAGLSPGWGSAVSKPLPQGLFSLSQLQPSGYGYFRQGGASLVLHALPCPFLSLPSPQCPDKALAWLTEEDMCFSPASHRHQKFSSLQEVLPLYSGKCSPLTVHLLEPPPPLLHQC